MNLRKVISTLWNGGLDPASAAPNHLGERRMISAIVFTLVPCSLILVIGNLLITGDMTRVVVISAVMACAITSLYLQTYTNKQRLAALSVLFALWFSPLLLMLNEGFSSTNWAWLLPVILLANYIMSRLASIVFTLMSVLVLIGIAALTSNGLVGQDIPMQLHASTIAVAGSLIFILACVLGYAYRTSQLKSEQQLQKSMEILREEVEIRRTAELKALAGERAKATFLATVSHELRTPLNGVIGASQLLSNRMLDAEAKELVSIVSSSANFLLEVINNVLDLSQLDEGKLELKNVPVNLRETVESCLAPLRLMSEAKYLYLKAELSDDIPAWVLTDGTRIQQLLINLVGNAVKFTDRGGIRVSLCRHNNGIQLTIQDTGVGIPEEKLQAVFDPFVQADSSVDRKFGGSGLGLTVVQRLVKLMNGTIDVKSTEGTGTTFRLWLPLQECDAPNRPAPQIVDAMEVSSAQPKQPVTVLVTDDNLVNRQVANKLLQKLGCEVIEASDGQEASQ